MKRLITLIITAILAVPAMGRTDGNVRGEGLVTVLDDDWDNLTVSFITSELTFGETTLGGERFAVPTMEGYLSSNCVGLPALPVFSQLIEVPLCSGYEVRVTNAVFDTLEAPSMPVLPVQPPRRKSDRSVPVLVMDRTAYAADSFYHEPMALVEPIGIARDRNLARLQFAPVSYNPVSHKLIVCRQATVTVAYRDADASASKIHFERYYTPAFTPAVDVLNNLYPKGVSSTAPVRYLIVSHSMFRNQLDEFVQWKRRKGFIVDVAYTDNAAVGTTTTSIAAYIKSLYTNATTASPAPTYLLLVGDVAQIPAFTGVTDTEHVSDLYYATWTMNDNVPDCYYGRFSASNIAQLTPQVEKTLMYEQYTFADPTFLDRAVMVSGVDAGNAGDNAYTYGDPSMDYAITHYVNGSRGFQQVRYFKNDLSIVPTATHVTMGGNSSAQSDYVRSCYNEGAGLINYTAHGSPTCWGTPYLGTDNVPQMTNYQKFGLMIGNCCQSNTFTIDACLGEALLRRGNYCGAVGYIGASNSTYWTYDFYWTVGARSNVGPTMSLSYNSSNLGAYDCLCHTHNEAYSKWALSQGSIIMSGNLAVASKVGNNANYYWEIYHLMGDPSVMPYLTQAWTMDVTVQPVVTVGTASLQVEAVPYAYVALTDSATHTLVASAFANQLGVATLALPASLATGAYELAVSAQQYRTAFHSLHVVTPPLNEIYAFASSMTAATSPVAGDTLTYSVLVKNLGSMVANGVVLRLAADNPWITFTCDSVAVPVIMPGGTTSVAVTAVIGQQVADGSRVTLTATSTWGGTHSASVDFPIYVKAPVLQLSNASSSLNLLPGGNATVEVTVTNLGHAALPTSRLRLLSPTSLLTVTPLATDYLTLPAASSVTLRYSLQADSQLPQGIVVPLQLRLDGFYSTVDDSLLVVSSMSADETFEGGTFHITGWSQGNYPWAFTSSEAAGGLWSLRSNASLSHSQTSEVSLTHTFTHADSIRFRYQVSSERNYDKFYLYIDNQETLVASGTVDWTQAAYYVPAGTHTFRFAYAKDYSVSNGSDCAWIDNIVLPPVTVPARFRVDTVCQGALLTVGGDTLATDTPMSASHTVTNADGIWMEDYVVLPLSHTDTVVEACDSLRYGGQVYTESTLFGSLSVSATSCDSVTMHLTVNHSVSDTLTVVVDSTCYQWGDSLYSASGEYVQHFSTAAGCDSTLILRLTLATGEEGIDLAEPESIALYPNPTTGRVHFSSEVDEVAVYDASGRLLVTRLHVADIDLTTLPAGTYLLRIRRAAGITACRVVKR